MTDETYKPRVLNHREVDSIASAAGSLLSGDSHNVAAKSWAREALDLVETLRDVREVWNDINNKRREPRGKFAEEIDAALDFALTLSLDTGDNPRVGETVARLRQDVLDLVETVRETNHEATTDRQTLSAVRGVLKCDAGFEVEHALRLARNHDTLLSIRNEMHDALAARNLLAPDVPIVESLKTALDEREFFKGRHHEHLDKLDAVFALCAPLGVTSPNAGDAVLELVTELTGVAEALGGYKPRVGELADIARETVEARDDARNALAGINGTLAGVLPENIVTHARRPLARVHWLAREYKAIREHLKLVPLKTPLGGSSPAAHVGVLVADKNQLTEFVDMILKPLGLKYEGDMPSVVNEVERLAHDRRSSVELTAEFERLVAARNFAESSLLEVCARVGIVFEGDRDKLLRDAEAVGPKLALWRDERERVFDYLVGHWSATVEINRKRPLLDSVVNVLNYWQAYGRGVAGEVCAILDREMIDGDGLTERVERLVALLREAEGSKERLHAELAEAQSARDAHAASLAVFVQDTCEMSDALSAALGERGMLHKMVERAAALIKAGRFMHSDIVERLITFADELAEPLGWKIDLDRPDDLGRALAEVKRWRTQLEFAGKTLTLAGAPAHGLTVAERCEWLAKQRDNFKEHATGRGMFAEAQNRRAFEAARVAGDVERRAAGEVAEALRSCDAASGGLGFMLDWSLVQRVHHLHNLYTTERERATGLLADLDRLASVGLEMTVDKLAERLRDYRAAERALRVAGMFDGETLIDAVREVGKRLVNAEAKAADEQRRRVEFEIQASDVVNNRRAERERLARALGVEPGDDLVKAAASVRASRNVLVADFGRIKRALKGANVLDAELVSEGVEMLAAGYAAITERLNAFERAAFDEYMTAREAFFFGVADFDDVDEAGRLEAFDRWYKERPADKGTGVAADRRKLAFEAYRAGYSARHGSSVVSLSKLREQFDPWLARLLASDGSESKGETPCGGHVWEFGRCRFCGHVLDESEQERCDRYADESRADFESEAQS